MSRIQLLSIHTLIFGDTCSLPASSRPLPQVSAVQPRPHILPPLAAHSVSSPLKTQPEANPALGSCPPGTAATGNLLGPVRSHPSSAPNPSEEAGPTVHLICLQFLYLHPSLHLPPLQPHRLCVLFLQRSSHMPTAGVSVHKAPVLTSTDHGFKTADPSHPPCTLDSCSPSPGSPSLLPRSCLQARELAVLLPAFCSNAKRLSTQ